MARYLVIDRQKVTVSASGLKYLTAPGSYSYDKIAIKVLDGKFFDAA